MIGVDKIEDIRRRARGGEPIASIARAVGVSEPTARKYARMEDLSPEPPKRKEPESELLAPHRECVPSSRFEPAASLFSEPLRHDS